MSRPLRRAVVDGWYHVFGRGIERRAIFTTNRDREHFLELLSGLSERYRVRIHAYAQMDTHYHQTSVNDDLTRKLNTPTTRSMRDY